MLVSDSALSPEEWVAAKATFALAALAGKDGDLAACNEVLDAHRNGERLPKSYIKSTPGGGLTVKNVTVTTPDGKRTLVRNLSFELKPGEKLMIGHDQGSPFAGVLVPIPLLKGFIPVDFMVQGSAVRFAIFPRIRLSQDKGNDQELYR